MKIHLSNAGKRFNREWIFRNANLNFDETASVAITGPNGSGKSTLLQCLGGMLQLSEGNMQFERGGKTIADEKAHQHISFCAPYMDVIEEMTLEEFLGFHHEFKPYLPGFTGKKVMETIGLTHAALKQIRYYSSGMKQRVKLAQAILFDTDIVLLDEPCSNLDANGIRLYHSLIADYCSRRLVVVCSNDEVEYEFCKEVIAITDYKQSAPSRTAV
jgi:ABC-type multidrug transport system ATPase subunit